MSELKVTPGPWIVNGTSVYALGPDMRGEQVNRFWLSVQSSEQIHEAQIGEKIANAHLIGAAPELYEALEIGVKCLRMWLEYDECDCEGPGHTCGLPARLLDLELMEAALDKARGETGE